VVCFFFVVWRYLLLGIFVLCCSFKWFSDVSVWAVSTCFVTVVLGQ